MTVVLKEVVTRADLNKFISFPNSLYKGNKYFVPALAMDERATLSRGNPVFDECEACYWLAYKDGKIVGRVAGIINHAYIAKWKNRYARFGWIDFIDDDEVSAALTGAVEKWALSKGMAGVHGPLGFTDFDPEGLLVEGFDEPGTMTTIYNYPYYPVHFEKLGYKKDTDWVEYEVTVPGIFPGKIERLAKLAGQQLSVLKINKRSELLPYAPQVFELLNETYKDLYGVVPLSGKLVKMYTKQYFSFIDPSYISVILEKNEVVAFAIAMPSLTQALQRSGGKLFPFGFIHLYKAFKNNELADLYLIAVHPRARYKGASALLMHDLWKKFRDKNVKKAITHPMLETNIAVLGLWKQFDTRQVKRRRCYLKKLDV